MWSIFPSRVSAAVLLSGLGAGSWAAAQSPAFEALKKAHLAETAKTVQPLREGYCRALQTLEQNLAAQGDFEGARTVRKERLEMEQLTAGGGNSGGGNSARSALPVIGKDGSVQLSPAAAQTSSGVKYDDSQKCLTGWTVTGAAARWLLPPGLAEGGYEVEISCDFSPVADKGAGLFQVREDFHTLSRPLKQPESSGSGDAASPAPGPAGAGQTPPVVLGPLRLRSNAASFEIRALTPEPGSLLRIKSIRLIPATSSDS